MEKITSWKREQNNNDAIEMVNYDTMTLSVMFWLATIKIMTNRTGFLFSLHWKLNATSCH